MRGSPKRRAQTRAGDRLQRLLRRLPWYTSANTSEGRNIRNLYTETAWFGILNGLAATFVSVFALRLGATTAQVGWLTALPALVNIIWLIPAAGIIERQRRRLPLILLTGVLQRLGYLAMAAIPFLLATGRVEALIILNTVITFPTAVINTAITALIPDLTSADRRGQVISVRWLILSLVATASVLLGGRFLDLLPLPLNYQVLLGVGAALSLVGMFYLRRMRLPEVKRASQPKQPRQRHRWPALRQSVSEVLAQRGFVRFTAASFVLHWGLYLPAALWSVMRVRDLAASDTWIGIIAVVIDATTIGGYLYWGKVSAKKGDRWLLVVTSFGITLYALLTALVPSIQWMILTSIIGGLAWSGCNLALFRVMLSVSPANRRPTYIALYTALMNITAFAAPLLGAVLADWLGIRVAFAISGGVRLAGAVLYLVLLRR